MGSSISFCPAAFYAYICPYTDDEMDTFATIMQVILFLNYVAIIVIFAYSSYPRTPPLRTPFAACAIGLGALAANLIAGHGIAIYWTLKDIGFNFDFSHFSTKTINIVTAPLEARTRIEMIRVRCVPRRDVVVPAT